MQPDLLLGHLTSLGAIESDDLSVLNGCRLGIQASHLVKQLKNNSIEYLVMGGDYYDNTLQSSIERFLKEL